MFNRRISVWVGLGALLAVVDVARAADRTREKFDYDWRFSKSDPTNASRADFDDSAWRPLDLPHDWSIEETPDEKLRDGRMSGYFPGGIAWYRKLFTVPAGARGRKVIIEFDGVYHRSDVYLNGRHLGHRPYGYVSFQYDLTPHLRFDGENVLAVRVNHSDAPTSRWYSGSGLYRHVWLTTCDPLHVEQWGTFITTPEVASNAASIRIQTAITNEYDRAKSCALTTILQSPAGNDIASIETTREIPPGERSEIVQVVRIASPIPWSPDQPKLYVARTIVKEGDRVRDTYRTTFGIRAARFDASKGFLLNGQSLKLKGVCLHGDAGCLGAAVPGRAWERRLEVLKHMGCNAIRLSHNPPAPELLDLCDRMGFLVMDEAFDRWKSGSYYAKYFEPWWQRDLEAMVLRDRNHPGVVIWSVGNEVGEQGKPEGAQILRQLAGHVRRLDPTRPVTYAALPNRDAYGVNNNGFAEAMDVVSYNYQEQWYAEDKKKFPERIVLGSETYPFFRAQGAVGTVKPARHEFAPVNPWYDVAKNDWVAGQFIWSGMDYLGESAGWPSKGWCNGLIDTCGFPKPRAGFHRAAWQTHPVVQIAVLDDSLDIDPGRAMWSWPRMWRGWNYPTRDVVRRVQTFTNCRTVELRRDGTSFGVREAAAYPNSTIEWLVPWHAGKLEAIGRNDPDGPALATDEIQTAGPPAKIVLKPDRVRVTADGQDICHIEANLVDDKGVLVPNDDRQITFTVTGAGKLAGTDNGDLRSNESYQGKQRTTRWGRCLAVVQSSRAPGEIHVSAQAAGLTGATGKIETRPAGDSRR
jgi:beta-galactosidase